MTFRSARGGGRLDEKHNCGPTPGTVFYFFLLTSFSHSLAAQGFLSHSNSKWINKLWVRRITRCHLPTTHQVLNRQKTGTPSIRRSIPRPAAGTPYTCMGLVQTKDRARAPSPRCRLPPYDDRRCVGAMATTMSPTICFSSHRSGSIRCHVIVVPPE